MITAHQLTKRYGSVVALRNVSLHVAAGERVFICGANGSGKTTLLRLLAGAVRPTSGTLQWHDGATRFPAALFTHLHLYPQLSVQENLRLFAALYGASTSLLDEAMAFMQLEPHRNTMVGTLSRGWRQRVGLARTWLKCSPLLLLDEPLTGLDDDGIACAATLLHHAQNSGRAAVIATHRADRLAKPDDTLLVLERGNVLSLDRWDEQHLSDSSGGAT